MANPYLLMAVLYFSLAVFAALDSALVTLGVVPAFSGIVWLRAHFITLGALTEIVFGMLPLLVAGRGRASRPRMRWDIWLTLNAGLVTLMVGIPLVNGALMIAGGTLVFIAAVLLLKQVMDLPRVEPGTPLLARPEARKFYIASLSYLLVGIFVGTGLFVGWDVALGMQVPREVHVHANLWGFTSLLFAGLWVDLYPALTGRSFAWPRTIKWIFWLMTVGELGLVIGPWIGNNLILAPGLALHFSSTILLLANVIRPLWKDREVWTPGLYHLVTAYAWVAAPALMAPLIIIAFPGFPIAAVETAAPPMMIYGWLLQFGYGLFPYLFSRALLPAKPPRLGGNWLSLITVNAGAALILASGFVEAYASILNGMAFILWVLSMLPIALELWRIVRAGVTRIERGEDVTALESRVSLRQ